MKNIIKSALCVAIIFALNTGTILADGYQIYTPYRPHKPIATGIGDTSIFYILAVVLFVLGLATLSTAKAIKGELSK